MPEHQRQARQQRAHGGHHDGTEAQQARLVDRLVRRHALLALRFQGEVDHHDAVLLDDADEQDDADQRDHAQVVTARHEDEQRADAGRGQGRQNRQRVDVAFVEQPQHDVDRDQRRRDQVRLRRQRIAEGLGRALEVTRQRLRQAHLRLRLVDRVDRIAQRRARRQVERDRDRRELPLVADRQVGALAGVDLDESRERDLLAVERRGQVELVEQCRILLQRRRDLQHHVVAVELGEVLRHLPLPDGVVQRGVDGLRRDAEARCAIAVDGQHR